MEGAKHHLDAGEGEAPVDNVYVGSRSEHSTWDNERDGMPDGGQGERERREREERERELREVREARKREKEERGHRQQQGEERRQRLWRLDDIMGRVVGVVSLLVGILVALLILHPWDGAFPWWAYIVHFLLFSFAGGLPTYLVLREAWDRFSLSRYGNGKR